MVLECAGCHHSYDVSSYKAGQKLRCSCGQILVVPKNNPTIHVARTIHCSSCGGELVKGESNCRYCGALVDLTHARLTAYCSSCLAMSKAGAKFCSECAKPLVTRVETTEEADEKCPRCRVKMRKREIGAQKPLECPMCCGLFVEVDVLDEMIKEHKAQGALRATVPSAGPKKARLEPETVTYVKCPICETMMNRLNFGRISGVIVDYCRDHGYWLDAGELEKIAEWVKTGGLEKQKQKAAEEAKIEAARLSRSTNTGSVRFGADDYYDRDVRGSRDFTGSIMGLVSRLFDK